VLGIRIVAIPGITVTIWPESKKAGIAGLRHSVRLL